MYTPNGRVTAGSVAYTVTFNVSINDLFSPGRTMKTLFYYCWFALSGLWLGMPNGTNSGDIAITNLPEQILVNAGSYSAGTILYDSGQITHRKPPPLRIVGVGIYAQFGWSFGECGHLSNGYIYSTPCRYRYQRQSLAQYHGEYGGDTMISMLTIATLYR
jgi:hypothetical protein